MPAKPLTAEQKADAERLNAAWTQWQADQRAQGRAVSQESITEAIGIGQSAISQYLTGKIPLNPRRAAMFARLMGRSVGSFSPQLEAEVLALAAATNQDADSEFVRVERADVALSAGRGRIVFIEGQRSSLAFRHDFLRAQGVSAKNAVVVDVSGHSMEPTIPDGAVLLINRAAKEIANGRVYAFRLDGELLVKRMHRRDGTILAVSDNPDRVEFPEITIKGKADFDVIGRAIWMGGPL